MSYLRHLCEEALPKRYEVVDEKVRKRLDFELDIINTMAMLAISSLSGILSIIAVAMIFRSVRDAAVPQAVSWLSAAHNEYRALALPSAVRTLFKS